MSESLEVRSTYCVDSDEPNADGTYDWRYEYDLITMSQGGPVLTARSYRDEPEDAHLLNIEEDGIVRELNCDDLRTELWTQAVAELRARGKKSVRWLGPDGYAPVP